MFCQHVIVAVVPDASDDGKVLLTTVVSNSLQSADRVKSETVALPVIGRNFSGFDVDKHCQVLVDALVRYFQENPSSCIRKVNFVDLAPFAALEKHLKNHKDISKLEKPGMQYFPADNTMCFFFQLI